MKAAKLTDFKMHAMLPPSWGVEGEDWQPSSVISAQSSSYCNQQVTDGFAEFPFSTAAVSTFVRGPDDIGSRTEVSLYFTYTSTPWTSPTPTSLSTDATSPTSSGSQELALEDYDKFGAYLEKVCHPYNSTGLDMEAPCNVVTALKDSCVYGYDTQNDTTSPPAMSPSQQQQCFCDQGYWQYLEG